MELKKNSTVSEELRYDSVVAVNPGEYEVELMGDDGLVKSQSRLVALNHESYVVLRTGVEDQQGQQYPPRNIQQTILQTGFKSMSIQPSVPGYDQRDAGKGGEEVDQPAEEDQL